MRINVYRLRAWIAEGRKKGELRHEFDYEFKDEQYEAMKAELWYEGYRVQELIAWS